MVAIKRVIVILVVIFAYGVLPAAAASARTTRTWVSGVGDDINPCSRTLLCKTLGAALALTVPGGEINCLDAVGFDTVYITKSVSILCDDVYARPLGVGGIDMHPGGVANRRGGADAASNSSGRTDP